MSPGRAKRARHRVCFAMYARARARRTDGAGPSRGRPYRSSHPLSGLQPGPNAGPAQLVQVAVAVAVTSLMFIPIVYMLSHTDVNCFIVTWNTKPPIDICMSVRYTSSMNNEAVDVDGMPRVNIEWSIEGKTSTKTGKLYGLHSEELANAKLAIARRARRGDTINVREF